ELAHRLALAAHPQSALDLAPEPRLLLQRGADPALLDPLAVAVDRLVAEVPPVERVVELELDEILAGGRTVPSAQVHRGLLAGLDDADDVGDQSLGQEVVEGRPADLVVVELFDVQPGCPFDRMWACAGQWPRVPGTQRAAPSG